MSREGHRRAQAAASTRHGPRRRRSRGQPLVASAQTRSPISGLIGLLIFALSVLCTRASSPPPEDPVLAEPTCRAILTPASATDVGVTFELTNPTDLPLAVTSFEPFVAFTVRARADGAELAVVRPALDVPTQKRAQTIPPHATIELASPIRLRFAAGPPATDRFVWSIAHAPAGVELTFELDLPAPLDQPFTAAL